MRRLLPALSIAFALVHGCGEKLQISESPPDGGGTTDATAADGPSITLTPMILFEAASLRSAFEIDATEVTQRQYAEFLAHRPEPTEQAPDCAANTTFLPTQDFAPDARPDRPVVGVDWCDAVAYCRWAGKHLCGGIGGKTGRYDEASSAIANEWMAACTNDGERSFPYGSSERPTACNVLQTADGSVEDVGSRSECEGSLPGLRDMVGNASEWVNHCSEDGACVILGGSFRFPQVGPVGCSAFTASGRGATFADLSFRCCR